MDTKEMFDGLYIMVEYIICIRASMAICIHFHIQTQLIPARGANSTDLMFGGFLAYHKRVCTQEAL